MEFMIPTLATERLTLRAPCNADFPVYAEIFASDRSIYMDGPLDRDAAWHGFASDIIGWLVHGYGYWTVVESSSGDFVGLVGLAKPPYYPERELGWMVTAEQEGKGYAYEASLAARSFAYENLGFPTLVSYIDPPNQRSIALAKRLGAILDQSADSPSPGDLVYRHPEPEAIR